MLVSSAAASTPRPSNLLRPRRLVLMALAAIGLLASGCGNDVAGVQFCEADDECSGGERCVQSICVDPNTLTDVVDPDVGDLPDNDTTETGADTSSDVADTSEDVADTLEDAPDDTVDATDTAEDAVDTTDSVDTVDTVDAVDMDDVAMCGNGTLDAGESCDDTELGGQDCTTQGFDGGTLSCASDCTFDTSDCMMTTCGDGTLDTGEDCEGDDLAGQTCQSLGQGFTSGTLACSNTCQFDTTGCTSPTCGNDTTEAGEVCDGSDLAGESCTTQGLSGGTLACASDCMGFDTTGCTSCGDGVQNGNEDCDSLDLAGATCQSQGFSGGALTCASDCTFDTTACTINTCGNGNINMGEQCDGANLDGADCTTLGQGFTGGTLTCGANCQYNTTGCTSPMCGNATIDAGEACDGAMLGGETCQSQGFDRGVLLCDANCGFDTSGCSACGDGTVDAGEQCDDGNTNPGDGCDATCQTETTAGDLTVRFTDLALRDPHIFVLAFGFFCADGTDVGSGANDQIAAAMNGDADGDGYRDLALVSRFTPLDQNTTTATPMANGPALCSINSNTCQPDPANPLTTTTYTSRLTGMDCLTPTMGTTSGYNPAVTSSSAPCFVSAPTTLTLMLGPTPIPLTDSQIGGTFVGSPATAITNGLVKGFLAESVADSIMIDLGQGEGPQPLSRYLPGGTGSCAAGDDRDTHNGVSGWWFYLNFNAAEVTWTP